jgi:hypothetical protein
MTAEEKPMKASPDHSAAELMLPAQLDSVTIVGPDGERAQAQIAERDRTSLVVAPLRGSVKQLSASAPEHLVLEFTTAAGRMRVHGDVALEDDDHMRFAAVESPEALQEREYVRVPTEPPVSVQIAAGEDRLLSYTVNVSGGGILLAGPSTLNLGDELALRLITAQGAAPIKATGVVVRADAGGRRAICFKEIGDGDRRRLVRFIFELLRQQRHSTRTRDDGDGS